MAAISGKDGAVQYKGATVLRINSWSLDVDVNDLETTAFSTDAVQWRSFIAGLSGFSGNLSGYFDIPGSTAQKDLQTNVLTPATGTVNLYTAESAGDYYSGDVVLTRQSVSVDIDGTADVSYDFRGNGALSFTTA